MRVRASSHRSCSRPFRALTVVWVVIWGAAVSVAGASVAFAQGQIADTSGAPALMAQGYDIEVEVTPAVDCDPVPIRVETVAVPDAPTGLILGLSALLLFGRARRLAAR
jgi:hypothetical protein